MHASLRHTQVFSRVIRPAIAVVAAILAASFAFAQVSDFVTEPEEPVDPALVKSIDPGLVGTYVFDAARESVPSASTRTPPTKLNAIPGSMVLHADGTAIVRIPFTTAEQYPAFGTWRKIGNHTLRVVYFHVAPARTSSASRSISPHGTTRVVLNLAITSDLPIFDGTLLTEYFLNTQDPFHPSTIAHSVLRGTISDARLTFL